MDINTLRQLRGLKADKSSHLQKADFPVSSEVSSNDVPVMTETVKPEKSAKSETPQIAKDSHLSQTDLAQIIRQARGIGVSVSQNENIIQSSDEGVYQFITPDMIDENGYLKMSMEDQKALIDGIYKFFSTGLEPSPSPQNSENSDE